MKTRRIISIPICGLISLLLFACSTPPPENKPIPKASTYEELVELFHEWRTFATPKVSDGIPDYSSSAMDQQHRELRDWQLRLQSFDTTGWPIKNQIDWYLIWAEMNGLDFEHRVQQPWANDPAFYVWFYSSPTDVPEREGPTISGAIELPKFEMPLSSSDAALIAGQLRKTEALYQQARINLTGNGKDLWATASRSLHEQSSELKSFQDKIKNDYPDLAAATEAAWNASEQFASWVAEQAPTKNGLSGVGKANYNWYLHNVHLVPYDWEGEKVLMERELARANSSFALNEHRYRSLPTLKKIDNASDFDRIMNAGVSDFMRFLKEREVMTVKPYMDPAMRAQIGKFNPSHDLLGFFYEVDYRDPMPMRCHQYHWIELARYREEPYESPIRQEPALSNIWDGRAEGMATAMEELMMNAGLYEHRPKATSLVYIMLAERAARGLGSLYQHGLEMNLEQAIQFASKGVPWGLLPADGETIQHEEQFYLQQPGYGTSYVTGKAQIDELIAEYSRQRNDKFVLKEFMDEFNRVGVIPVSLIYWQMTGRKDMLERAISSKN